MVPPFEECVCACVCVCVCVCSQVAFALRLCAVLFGGDSISKSTQWLIARVAQSHLSTVHIRYFWQGNHQIYVHIRCIYMILANPKYVSVLKIIRCVKIRCV